ncbi:MAG: phage major capsid protein [Burkholderiaceae bacterium]
MSKEIIEKLDAIEAAQDAKIAEVTAAAVAAVEAVKSEVSDKIAALEAKVASVQAPALIQVAKSVRSDVNRSVKEQLLGFYKGSGKTHQELKIFADESQMHAYLAEASALTGSGDGKGGRTGYDPLFAAMRLANPMRGLSQAVVTDSSSYQFRVKTGNAGAQWGYGIQNNGGGTSEDTSIWQVVAKDVNVQFPIRTSALNDIDGLDSVIVDDMLAEFAQVEAMSMVQNNDQSGSGSSVATGGADGLRGLDQYGGAAGTYAGGKTTDAAFGASGTGASSGLHSLATYDQLTTNANTVGANNVSYNDVINMIYALPQQYWTESAKIMVSPILLSAIRGLKDSNGTPIFNRNEGLSVNGIVGQLLGFDVVVNKYLDNPSQANAGAAGTSSLFPMYFADWSKFHTIVDRMNLVVQRYDQTLPGSITFYGEKRLATSVRDPGAGVRYRSSGTAS